MFVNPPATIPPTCCPSSIRMTEAPDRAAATAAATPAGVAATTTTSARSVSAAADTPLMAPASAIKRQDFNFIRRFAQRSRAVCRFGPPDYNQAACHIFRGPRGTRNWFRFDEKQTSWKLPFVASMGKTASFYVPADKVNDSKYGRDGRKPSQMFEEFFVTHFGGFTHEQSQIKGRWMGEGGNKLFIDEHQRYEVAFAGHDGDRSSSNSSPTCAD